MRLADLATPALILDRTRLERNCAAMTARAARHGVRLRPHLKTAKAAEVAALATRGGFAGITVSTLAEAAYFAEAGIRDMTYAVGIAPGKTTALAEIARRHGATIGIIADSSVAVAAADREAAAAGVRFPVLVEIDTGGGRGGLDPEGGDLPTVARAIHAAPALDLAGVLTHAGHSYHAHGLPAIRAIAEAERAGAVRAAARLRAAGLPCGTVSVGSTPTMIAAERLDGVTEIRPGVYTVFDLHQAALGVCGEDDIALSVLATVIGHNPRSRRVLIDAGALALSKDLSAGEFRDDVGYGLVRPASPDAPALPHLYVADVHQEHGLVAALHGDPPWERLPVGAKVRVLPNHACMTAAPFDRYHVDTGDGHVGAVWPKAVGW